MADNDLKGLVQDWGGFERLITKLNETGTAQVEHNVVLTGRSGAPRQIDVAIRHREGLYEHLIIVECKYWKENVSRLHVDALQSAIHDLGASKGVIFSVAGFQEGAITAAKHNNIELFRVRDISDEEWGSPGRIVDFYMQYLERSIGNFRIEEAVALGPSQGPLNLVINLGDPAKNSVTPTVNQDGSPGKTFEEILSDVSQRSLESFTKEGLLFHGGAEGVYYLGGHVNFVPQDPLLIEVAGVRVQLKRMTFDLGIRITQNRFHLDRSANYQFALLIEDSIRKTTSTASRKKAENVTSLAPYEKPSVAKDETLKNGSIMKIYLTNMFPYSEIAHLQPVSIDSVRKSL